MNQAARSKKYSFFSKIHGYFLWITLLALVAGCSGDAHESADDSSSKSTSNSEINFQTMTTIKLKGNEIHTSGKLPEVGSQANDFTLTAVDLSDKSLSDYKGKRVILNIFPSINTGVCASSVRQFNKDAADLENTVVLCISKDLPFAQDQFCGAEGIKNVVMLSDFRSDFGHEYGVQMTDGPLRGLLSRAVIVLDADGKVKYTEQVPEITQEPDYKSALAALN